MLLIGRKVNPSPNLLDPDPGNGGGKRCGKGTGVQAQGV